MSGIIFLDLNFFFSEFKLLLHYLLPLTERYSNLEPDTVPPWKEPGFLLVFSLSLNFNNLSSIVSVCFLLQRHCGNLLQTVSLQCKTVQERFPCHCLVEGNVPVCSGLEVVIGMAFLLSTLCRSRKGKTLSFSQPLLRTLVHYDRHVKHS